MIRVRLPVEAIKDSMMITGKKWDAEDVEMLFIASNVIFSLLLSCSPAMVGLLKVYFL